MRISETITAGGSRPLPGNWANFYCSSVSTSGTQVSILGQYEGQTFVLRRGVTLDLLRTVSGLRLINPTGATVVIEGHYGAEKYGSTLAAGEEITINSDTPINVDIAANAALSVSADDSVADTDKTDFAAPAGAKGAIVSLITPGTTFGDVRVSGDNAYAASTGVPLPVAGAAIYIDAGADLTVHNTSGGAVSVNVTWIS